MERERAVGEGEGGRVVEMGWFGVCLLSLWKVSCLVLCVRMVDDDRDVKLTDYGE